jgi:hypothetical protein
VARNSQISGSASLNLGFGLSFVGVGTRALGLRTGILALVTN